MEQIDKSLELLPNCREASVQQPLSLMTINANPKRKEDLLTIRILESSERKMQLIKKLLSPEEYSNVSLGLFNSNYNIEEHFDSDKQPSPMKTNNSVPVQLEQQVEIETERLIDKKRFSLNESKLNLSRGTRDLHESLAKKREAIDFFFQNPSDNSEVNQSDLAIELRSGYYMESNGDRESKVLKEPSFSLMDRLMGLLGFIGISFGETDETAREDDGDYEQQELEFEQKHRKLNVAPYASRRNLRVMARRLKNDGQLDKILEMADRSLVEPEMTTLVDLAKLHQIQLQINVQHQQERNFSANQSVKVIESVGHFNTIHLLGPKPFNQNLPISQLLVYSSRVENVVRVIRRRKELSSTAIDQLNSTGSIVKLLKVNLISIKIKRHHCMTIEEGLALNLMDKQDLISKLRELLKKSTTELEEAIYKSTTNEVKEIFKSHLHLMERLQSLKEEIQMRCSELESLRKEQKFNSSSLAIKVCKNNIESDGYDLRSKLENFIKRAEANQEVLDLCKSYIDSFPSPQESVEAIELDELGMEVTPDNRCPPEEKARRKRIRDWLKSLELRVLIGDRYQCRAVTTTNLELYSLNLSKSLFSMPYIVGQKSIELQFKLYQGEGIGFLKLPSTLIASKTQKLSTDSTMAEQQVIELQFFDETIRGELRLVSALGNDQYCDEEEQKLHKYIDNLHANAIKKGRHQFENFNTKLHNLINKVDFETLLSANREIDKEQLFGNKREYFCLDPLVDYFDEDLEHKNRVDIQSGQIRQSLLTWRWLNELNNLIYLSNHENLKQFSFQMEEFTTRNKSLPMKQVTKGFRRIEQNRLWAVDCLKEYELQLAKVLKYEQERQLKGTESQQQQQQRRVEDLLQEPKLRVDFSGVARMTRRLVPQRKPHRPLMPRRKATTDKWPAHLLSASHLLDVESSQELDSSTDRKSIPGSLQLVVTIQQASNVPMRVVLNPNQTSRSVSPLLGSTTARSPTPLMSTGNYLVPPTTYVEVVFQRRQQASSLSQGKQPTWNETLFFPVDFGTNYQQQLVDEFLQLNLYDYHCHYQQQASPNHYFDQPMEQQSTMVLMNSSLLESTAQEQSVATRATATAQRVLASRQRIERHLLGSLRIPLTTLMSTGRIEGSFELNQPLILDNYQFEQPQKTLLTSTINLPPTQLAHKTLKQTHMSLFITLDPPITLPSHLYLPIGSHEPQPVFEYARQWEQVMAQCNSNRHHQHQERRAAAAASGASGDKLFRRHRHVRCLVLQRDAKYCLINRLLTPLEPPGELLEGKSEPLDQMKALARFVSLLSPLKHGLLDMRLLAPSLWFDSIQLINKTLGGPEEKAVLLCNYYLHLGKCSALVMGDSIHEGRCVYVIVWSEQSRFVVKDTLQQTLEFENLNSNINGCESVTRDNFLTKLPVNVNAKSVQIWDPNLGKLYTLDDQLPLLSVGSIATVENVYANLQSQGLSPTDTNYDLRFGHLWFPLFDQYSQVQANNSLPSSSLTSHSKLRATSWRRQRLQLEQVRKSIGSPPMEPIFNLQAKIDYSKLGGTECEELKANIERVIKAQLLKWRPDRPTYFNRTLSRLLADKLALFEGRLEEPDWRQELADSIRSEVLMAHLAPSGLQTRQVISCPLNLSYTSMRTILDLIFASGVQNADLILDPSQRQSASSIQFLVACHVHPYPAQVVSVWLYVAAVVTTTNNQTDMYSFLGVQP